MLCVFFLVPMSAASHDSLRLSWWSIHICQRIRRYSYNLYNTRSVCWSDYSSDEYLDRNSICHPFCWSTSMAQGSGKHSGCAGPFDEDCLYLNVWAPRAPPPVRSKGYPVMYWIHGRGFMESSTTQAIFDGLSWTNDAVEANNSFIMVSINYRLNTMGFFAQPTLVV